MQTTTSDEEYSIYLLCQSLCKIQKVTKREIFLIVELPFATTPKLNTSCHLLFSRDEGIVHPNCVIYD